MEAEVNVTAENPVTGECVHTNTAYVLYVAMDDEGKPIEVPRLIAETEEEKERMLEGEKRQEYRLTQRRRIDSAGNHQKADRK